MRSKSVKIYMQVGNNEPVFLEKCRNKESAELKIRHYERQDRYEVEVEKYAMPAHGYPVYTIQ